MATLLALAYGTRVEGPGAEDCTRQPQSAGSPPASRPARTVSVIRHGIDWLRRLAQGPPLEPRLALPEPWPEPKLNQITRHVPP